MTVTASAWSGAWPGRLAGLVGCALLFVGCAGEGGARRGPLVTGDLAPEYGARALDGDSVDLADLRGRPVLVNVWATWCAPCRAEMPELQGLYELYGERLEVVGVSIDAPGSESRIEAFLEEVGVSFPILFDPAQRIVSRFTTVGVPETFLFDASGVLRQRWTGRYEPLSATNIGHVEAVLGESE